MAISKWTWVSLYQNVSTVDFIGAKDDGGPKWMRSPGINGEGELRGQLANSGSLGRNGR